LEVPPHATARRTYLRRAPAISYLSCAVALDDARFESLLEQVRELHRRTDEITRSKTRMHDNIRARLSWNDPPSLPSDQRKLADEVVDALTTPSLSSLQSQQLWRAYFGR
jgi:hypothetical protein